MIRETFIATCRVMHDFIGVAPVREQWHEASALPEMSVGAVAGHTARAALRVEDSLNEAPPAPDAGPPVSAAQYYLRLEGLTDPASATNVGIRERAAATAAAGVDDLLWRIGETVARLPGRLADEAPERLITLPSGRPMLLDDYLRTRLIELTVHLDDLAVSVDLPTPLMPAEAMDEAISTLLVAAIARHGDLAVLRAMTRAERDHAQALRVL